MGRRGRVEVIALLAWADIRQFLRSVDETNHVATLSSDRVLPIKNNARYYIENAPDGCDSPGEWYEQVGISLTSHNRGGPVEVGSRRKSLDDLVSSSGLLRRAGSTRGLARDVQSFHWPMATMDMPTPKRPLPCAATCGPSRGGLRGRRLFTHLAGYALELGRGCQRWKVAGNEMSDLGGGGFRLGEPAKRQDPFEANHDHAVTDNEIHHLGIVYPPAVGVFILQSGTNRVAHNHIHHLYYTAVSVGWNWGYQETPCRENIVEFNHMHDVGQSLLSDMGAVYTLGIQKGSVIRNNLIHDVSAFTYGGWGLYPDEGSTDIVWENNVVYRCKSAGFHQHYGRENLVRNNVFAFSRENQLMRTREEQHVSFIFTNNIVYFDSGNYSAAIGRTTTTGSAAMSISTRGSARSPEMVLRSDLGAMVPGATGEFGVADPHFVARASWTSGSKRIRRH